MNKQRTFTLLSLGIATLGLGYLLAYLLFSEMLIAALSTNVESGKWLRGYLGDIIFQLFCGFPPAIFTGVVIVLIIISSNSFKKTTTWVGVLIVGLVGLIVGFIFYFPHQYLLIMGAAF
jgi:hypothetical protein